jgi:hypothetical protein
VNSPQRVACSGEMQPALSQGVSSGLPSQRVVWFSIASAQGWRAVVILSGASVVVSGVGQIGTIPLHPSAHRRFIDSPPTVFPAGRCLVLCPLRRYQLES